MTTPTVHLTLDDARDVYYPGEILTGTFRVDPWPDNVLQALEISVLWTTEGKGDEDMAVHFFERLTDDHDDGRELHQSRRFSTTLPRSPLSYEGVIVKIRWRVRLRVFGSRGKQFVEERSFGLGTIPPAHAILPSATSPPRE